MIPLDVKFVSEKIENAFHSLENNDPIKKVIIRAIKDLQQDAFFGIQIPKRLFPKEYIKKYSITNLWKYDLPNGWRLIYTINPENEVKIMTAILEWFDHENYERKFKY